MQRGLVQRDGVHLTVQGQRAAAAMLLPEVIAANGEPQRARQRAHILRCETERERPSGVGTYSRTGSAQQGQMLHPRIRFG